ncbi:MAG: response regulator transcription factor [Sporichthyaceae bacterium]
MIVRVVVADDEMLMREGVRQSLAACEDIEVVAVCQDGDELLAAIEAHEFDVLVTDIRMPPTKTDEGIRAAQAVRDRRPEAGVVVLSQYAEPAYAAALLAGGSAGRAYMLKERVASPEDLANVVRVVAGGGSFVEPAVVEAFVKDAAPGADPLHALTAREIEVLSEMALGKTNASVARSLFIEEKSVEKHIGRIFAKLELGDESDMHRRVVAVRLYLSAGDRLARRH